MHNLDGYNCRSLESPLGEDILEFGNFLVSYIEVVICMTQKLLDNLFMSMRLLVIVITCVRAIYPLDLM